MEELPNKTGELAIHEARKKARLLGVLGALIGLIIGVTFLSSGSTMLSHDQMGERVYYGMTLGLWLTIVGAIFTPIGAISLIGTALALKKPKLGAVIQLCVGVILTFFILYAALITPQQFLGLFWLFWPALHIGAGMWLLETT